MKRFKQIRPQIVDKSSRLYDKPEGLEKSLYDLILNEYIEHFPQIEAEKYTEQYISEWIKEEKNYSSNCGIFLNNSDKQKFNEEFLSIVRQFKLFIYAFFIVGFISWISLSIPSGGGYKLLSHLFIGLVLIFSLSKINIKNKGKEE